MSMRRMTLSAREEESRRTGSGSWANVKEVRVGWIMMREFETFSTFRTERMKAVSSGDWLKTCRKGERRRWNMNWG